MRANGSVDFEAMVLVAIAKADKRLLEVEERATIEALEKHHSDSETMASSRFAEALQQADHTPVLETLSAVSKDMTLEQKLQLLRNCWRVAISDEELHPSEEALIYNIVDELKVSRRTFTNDQQRLAG